MKISDPSLFSMFKFVTKWDYYNVGCLSTVACARLTSRSKTCVIVRLSSTYSYYDILGVNKKSSTQEIKDAFIRLSKEIHPDRDPSDVSRHSRFVQLNEAYTVLIKPSSRRLYDLTLEQPHQFRPSPAFTSNMNVNPMSSNNMNEKSGSFHENSRRTYYEYSGFWDPGGQSNQNSKRYYGIKGLGRVPNYIVVVGCCLLLVFGSIGHFFAIRYSNKVSGEIMDAKDKMYGGEYKALKELTKKNGDAAQIELLRKRLAGN